MGKQHLHGDTTCGCCGRDVEADESMSACEAAGCSVLICCACTGRGEDFCASHVEQAERSFERDGDDHIHDIWKDAAKHTESDDTSDVAIDTEAEHE